MLQSIPDLGTSLLLAVLVLAGYTFALSVAAATGRPRLLSAARHAAYGTSALITTAVLVLTYAFVSHDFRVSYVARYSDRSMPMGYLIAALWGGQDGSLLWWLFLTAAFVAACVWWMRGRYIPLQPYVIATLMVIAMFFTLVMVFGADPFATTAFGAPADGSGLNPLLQSIYMTIHPPSLYIGFVGCSIPFAFAIAALITGRLDNEWIVAVRKWMLFAWLFLSIGNALGMLWAYVELGWGGYWAWDPVENAAFLPWLSATAYVHSTMIQERRSMVKLWNLFLICLTFFLTIFGTFLTRSGMIASVHSFAQSEIGTYFLWVLGLITATCVALIVWRAPKLRAEANIESPLSREAAFVANNWALLGATLFVTIATTFPIISKAIMKETVTVGPTFYNRWMVPIGLILFFLMGAAPLFGWRKTSEKALRNGFTIPLSVAAIVAVLHLALGRSLGFPAIVPGDPIVAGPVGLALQKLGAVVPLITSTLAAFNLAVVFQEFWKGAASRAKGTGENPLAALFNLISKARRRYGGYIVHAGITLMFLGFLGQAWGVNGEASLKTGENYKIDGITLRHQGVREEVDTAKRMTFADISIVDRGGNDRGLLSPAKFSYRSRPDQPTTEIAVMHTLREDVYLVIGSADANTGRITLQAHINPLVSWIWIGVLILILGTSISLWPEVSLAKVGVWGYAKAASTTIAGITFALLLAALPARAYAFGGRSTFSVPDRPASAAVPSTPIDAR